ncbi:MAG: ABC transporter permease [Mariprofundaceae bacterium]|nr:ABC transporter permease [Mariprofundaceae bacterium]
MLIRHIKTAGNSLYTAKQRTLLALLGMSIGIASVIAMLSVGLMYGEETMRQYQALGSDMLSIGYQREPRDNSSDDSDSDRKKPAMTAALVQALPEHLHSIAMAAPEANSYAWFDFDGTSGYVWDFIGTTQNYRALNGIKIQQGRFISDLDAHQHTVVLSGDFLNTKAFRTYKKNIIGATIMLRDREYHIVGVLAENAMLNSAGGNVIRKTAYTHISNMRQQRDGRTVGVVHAKLTAGADAAQTAEAIEQYFAKRVSGLKVKVIFSKSLIERKQKQANMQTLLLTVIGAIAMLVAGVGIMNVMLTSVTERKQEIGILRAIGARQADIRWQFFIEAVILSLLGGAIGTALGVAAAYGYAQVQELTFFVSTFAIFVGVGVSTAIGIIFGLYPAHKAAKLDPITALRAV